MRWLIFSYPYQFSTVQLFSHFRLFATPMDCSTPGFPVTNSWRLLKLMSVESVMPSNHLSLPSLLLLPSIFPSFKIFSSESVLRVRWPKYWSFSSSIRTSNEYSELIYFRIGLISLQSKGLARVYSNNKVQNSLVLSFLYSPTLTSIHY